MIIQLDEPRCWGGLEDDEASDAGDYDPVVPPPRRAVDVDDGNDSDDDFEPCARSVGCVTLDLNLTACLSGEF